MRFGLRLLILTFTVSLHLAWAGITETARMQGALETPTKGTLIVFDLDNTLIQTKQTLGSVQWHDWYNGTLKAQGKDSEAVANEGALEWIRYQKASENELVEPEIPKLLRGLQRSGFKVLALTSRPFDNDILLRTHRDLNRLGIHFEQSWPRHRFQSELPGVSFSRGVLFVGHLQSKGDVLEEFILGLKDKPKRVRFIDDKRKYLEAVEKKMETLGIAFEGFRYGGADERVKSFDPDLAKFQAEYFKKNGALLSDEKARQLRSKK